MTKRNVMHCDKEAEIAIIQTKVLSIEEKITEIHKSMIGNGKPGIITRLDKQDGAISAIKWLIGISIPLFAIIVAIV